MKKKPKDPPIKGKAVSKSDLFYLEWGAESLKSNIATCNELLKQMIGLSVALLGVGIVFEDIVSVKLVRVIVLLLFFASMIVAFLGLLPYKGSVILNSVEEIKNHKEKALNYKRRFLWASSIFIMSAIMIVIVKLIFDLHTV